MKAGVKILLLGAASLGAYELYKPGTISNIITSVATAAENAAAPLLSDEQEAFIVNLNPSAQDKFRALIAAIEATGWDVIITSGFRTLNLMGYANGDYHNFGLALDVNLVKGTNWLRSTSSKADWEASGAPALAKSLGFRWGGDFVSTGFDPVHFDLGNTTPGNPLTTANLHALAQALNIQGNELPITV